MVGLPGGREERRIRPAGELTGSRKLSSLPEQLLREARGLCEDCAQAGSGRGAELTVECAADEGVPLGPGEDESRAGWVT